MFHAYAYIVNALVMFTFVELMFGFCLRVYVSRGSYFVYVFKKKKLSIFPLSILIKE